MPLFRRFFRYNASTISVAGLEISDTAIRLAIYNNGEFIRDSVNLNPGLIENGRVKDPAELENALKRLRERFAGGQEHFFANVSLPPSAVYSQHFFVPELADEAIRMNLEMHNPFSGEPYADYQVAESSAAKHDVLGAYVEKEFLDGWFLILEQAGIHPLSFEFAGLSLARAARERGAVVDWSWPHLILYLTNDGFGFLVMQNGQPAMHHFHPWSILHSDSRKTETEAAEQYVLKELENLEKVYFHTWGGKFDSVLVSADGISERLVLAIQKSGRWKARLLNLHGLPTNPIWAVACGASLRSHSGKKEISLGNSGWVKELYANEIKLSDFRGYRNLAWAALAVIAGALFLLDGAVYASQLWLNRQAAEISSDTSLAETVGLFNKKLEIERLADVSNQIKTGSLPAGEALTKILDAISAQITLSNLKMGEGMVFISASAPRADYITQFKKGLEGHFQNVILPEETKKANQNGSFSFQITFDY